MPQIKLKQNSPEFELPEQTETSVKHCDMPGCPGNGEHKAPKHRGLNEYYFFCYDHVREYNKAWDFFSGMSNTEVQDHLYKSFYGDRPTWKYNDPHMEEELHNKAKEQYFYTENQSNHNKAYHNDARFQIPEQTSAEHEAIAIMGLETPITIESVKTRYRMLAKKYHPDLNKNDPKAEELLKRINMAYTVLKLAFEEYKNLPER